MDPLAAQALIRFGLGPRGGEAPPADPHRWLAAQLDGPDPALALALPGLSVTDGLLAIRSEREQRKAGMQTTLVRDLYRAGTETAVRGLLTAAAPLRERLVWFWANHFTVSLKRPEIHAVVHAYLREAIRPNVTARFADMLLAVMRHPAMLLYLDNVASIGPDSRAGQRTKRGLNENLARECLELHTVGREAGYTQRDVTAFAEVLTGWGIDMEAPAPGFTFFPNRHEPGDKIVLGHSFPEGEEGGVAALRFLGTHPSTYKRIATALVRHFVADAPPPDAVRKLAGVLHDTGGDLKAATLAVLKLPAAWQPPLAKLRSPFDYSVAVVRALDLPPENQPDLPGVMGALGQPFLTAPLPNGWPDDAPSWADGELLLRRADWAMAVSGRAATLDPSVLAEASLGPLLSADTVQAVRGAGSRREGLALLFASPEFQRR
jgi:uncharacterized protein (DUF1800 family)